MIEKRFLLESVSLLFERRSFIDHVSQTSMRAANIRSIFLWTPDLEAAVRDVQGHERKGLATAEAAVLQRQRD